jgi:hypothetical protein
MSTLSHMLEMLEALIMAFILIYFMVLLALFFSTFSQKPQKHQDLPQPSRVSLEDYFEDEPFPYSLYF